MLTSFDCSLCVWWLWKGLSWLFSYTQTFVVPSSDPNANISPFFDHLTAVTLVFSPNGHFKRTYFGLLVCSSDLTLSEMSKKNYSWMLLNECVLALLSLDIVTSLSEAKATTPLQETSIQLVLNQFAEGGNEKLIFSMISPDFFNSVSYVSNSLLSSHLMFLFSFGKNGTLCTDLNKFARNLYIRKFTKRKFMKWNLKSQYHYIMYNYNRRWINWLYP